MTILRQLLKTGLPVLLCSAILHAPVYAAAPVAAPKDYVVLHADAKSERYDTQLFNLIDKNSVVGDKKFDKDFAARFDGLLQESRVAKDRNELKFLKKRLLSGPAPTPVYIAAFGKQYLYYEACQAHACDETHLSLLFDVATKAMAGNLVVSGTPSILGKPSPQEVKLLEQLRAAD